jgi:hypothetical protein
MYRIREINPISLPQNKRSMGATGEKRAMPGKGARAAEFVVLL